LKAIDVFTPLRKKDKTTSNSSYAKLKKYGLVRQFEVKDISGGASGETIYNVNIY
jgi:hypothetical protein